MLQGFTCSSPSTTQTGSSADRVSSWGKHVAKSRINTEQSNPMTEKNKEKKPFHSFLMKCKSLPCTQAHSAHSAHSFVFSSPRENSTCKEVWGKKTKMTQPETAPPQKAFKDNEMRETATSRQPKRWPYFIQYQMDCSDLAHLNMRALAFGNSRWAQSHNGSAQQCMTSYCTAHASW